MVFRIQTFDHIHIDQVALVAAEKTRGKLYSEIIQLCRKSVAFTALGQ